MKVAVVGGGPAGLYFALLLKKARPDADITVLERNRRDDTFGWGVVFSDQTLGNFRAADADSFARITASARPLGRHRRPRPRSGHHLERARLLRHRAQEAARDPAGALRGGRRHAALPDRGPRRSRIWLGTGWRTRMSSSPPTASTAPGGRGHAGQFAPGPRHPLGEVHLARHQPAARRVHVLLRRERRTACSRRTATASTPSTSTFIVECDEASWRRAGFDRLDLPQTVAACEALFAPLARRAPAQVERAAGGAAVDQLRARAQPRVVPRPPRPHRRRRAHRAFLDRLGHQAGDGGRHRAGAGAGRPEAAGRGARRVPGASG